MSDYARSGFRDAIEGVVAGIILSTILGVIPKLPSVPSYYVGIFQLIEVVNLLGSILLVFAMESWGAWYLIGWICGMWIMSSAGLVESWLFTIYAIVGVLVLIGKVLQKAKDWI
jgi:hypothetical protein